MRLKRSLRVESLEKKLPLTSNGWDGPGLGDAELTYYIGDIPDDIDEDQFRDMIVDAFAVWTDIVDIEITETNFSRQRDSIDISFGTIDGEGSTLAQAYLPDDVNRGRIAGDILFDSAESWEFGNLERHRANDLMLVAVHEIGHALGLGHDDEIGTIMFASVSPNSSFDELHEGDVDAILDLYAAAAIPVEVEGDLDGDGIRSVNDIDWFFERANAAAFDSAFDFNNDRQITTADRDYLIHELFDTVNGDANLDGIADAADLNVIGRNWQSTDVNGWRDGDFNYDGIVNAVDLNVVGTQWLNTSPSQSAALPETETGAAETESEDANETEVANDEPLEDRLDRDQPQTRWSRRVLFFSPRLRSGASWFASFAWQGWRVRLRVW